jgi:hypothetical protein
MEAVGQFKYDVMNAIDKGQVFAQLVEMMRQGASNDLTADEIAQMDEYTATQYSEIVAEAEMVDTYFNLPGDATHCFMTTTQIKDWIELNSKQKLSLKRLGMEIRRLGYQRIKRGGFYGYLIMKKSHPVGQVQTVDFGPNAPF